MKTQISEMSNKKDNHKIILGNLYEMNKQAMLSQPPLTKEQIDTIKPELEKWFNYTLDGYAMLLCRERYDFTVFHLYELQNPNPPRVAVTELISVLKNRGKILSIEKDSNTMNNAWEIWIKIGKETFAYYLFGCDDWVIEC
jgi:hypothetical protein